MVSHSESGVAKGLDRRTKGDSMTKARNRRRSWAAVLTVGVLALVVSMTAADAASAQSKSLTVGSKDFAGAQAISQAYGQALENEGYDISFKENLGATEIVYKALENGDLDGYADYQGTLLTYLGGAPTGDSATTYQALTDKLEGTDIVASKPAPAVDVNGFYVTKKTAKKYHLDSVSDLKRVDDKLTFGGPPECEDRPLCLGAADTGLSEQELYGLQFSDVKKLDAGGPITVKALDDGDIDVALLFTGSSVIPKDAVLLTDDKGLQPADNPVFLISKDKATPATMKILNEVSAKLSTKAYNTMSLDISENKEDPADVATAFLKKHDLD
jgi:osmoprotectant transport system substrate-binding protein